MEKNKEQIYNLFQMNRIRLLKYLLIFIFFVSTVIHAQEKYNFKVPDVDVESFVLVDAKTGSILVTKNPDKRLEPASLTKIALLYLVFKSLKNGVINIDDTTVISKKAWRMEGSRTFVEVNSKVKIKDLVKGVIVQSGNDASIALAEHIAGSEDFFVSMLNKLAVDLNLKNTNFTNVTGLPNPNHYSSAKDMAIISAKLIKDFPEYYLGFSERYFTYNKIRQPNRNRLLRSYNIVDGIKTGHTNSAGYCLAASAKKEDTRLISVLFGAESSRDRFRYSKTLLRFGFRNFVSKKFYSRNETLVESRVWKGEKKVLKIGFEEDIYLTLLKNKDYNIKTTIKVIDDLEAPIKKNQKVGTVEFIDGKEVIAADNIYALEDIQRGGFFRRSYDEIVQFFRKN